VLHEATTTYLGVAIDGGTSALPKHPLLDPWGEKLKKQLTPAEHRHLGASLHAALGNEANDDLGEVSASDLTNFAKAVVAVDETSDSRDRRQGLQLLMDGMLAILNPSTKGKAKPKEANCNAKAKSIRYPSCHDRPTARFTKLYGSCATLKKKGICPTSSQTLGGGKYPPNLYGFLLDDLSFMGTRKNMIKAYPKTGRARHKGLIVADLAAKFCPATCGFCGSPCVQRCLKMLRGKCEGPECGCGWTCPTWAHSAGTCKTLHAAFKSNLCTWICHNSADSQKVISFAGSLKALPGSSKALPGSSKALPGSSYYQPMEMTAGKTIKVARKIKLPRTFRKAPFDVIYFGDGLKLVNCFKDKTRRMKCMVKKYFAIQVQN